MKYLWAPWRMDYILRGKPKGCLFCRKPREKKDRANLILYQGKNAFVMMNKFPYSNGHLMVVPKRHCLDFEQLDDKELKEICDLLRVSTRVLKSSLRPHGFNIGMNLGNVGGAGEEHIHFHIVPRWLGDTNFMPILGETRIIPQYLEETYDRLRSAFANPLIRRKGQKGGRKR